jgi:hypothetical protein
MKSIYGVVLLFHEGYLQSTVSCVIHRSLEAVEHGVVLRYLHDLIANNGRAY